MLLPPALFALACALLAPVEAGRAPGRAASRPTQEMQQGRERPKPEANTTVRGRVVYDDTSRPVRRARLILAGEGEGQSLTFLTSVGDSVTADADHPIRVEEDAETGEPSPYVRVRAGLEALIARPVYYELAQLAIDEGSDPPGLWSDGAFFGLGGDA